ncbi:hypothetical protein ZYGR_0H01180 [Zygosaccharomyces rouxii]|uniref:PUM-HD domain-containing protein n=1 Tax=Zygosaccharomyces rouxii TaxID=4956 RepID=A0A1Q2ZUY7_ZYGRO|nr:hypothetical protein ZYGR_0H01180 [Zygosaccharomyces rouxii]
MVSMAKRNKQNGKRSFEAEKSTLQTAKKPRISVDSSDEEYDEPMKAPSDLGSEDEDELDELDDVDEQEADGSDQEEGEGGLEDSEGEEEGDVKEQDNDTEGKHKEQRKFLRERKQSRKGGTQVQQIKSLWEKLRVKNAPIPRAERQELSDQVWELSKDCISDLVLKHDASRVVQTLVKYSSKERREQIVDALKGKFYLLATSAYGKYLLVKLLHYGSRKSRQTIIDELHGCLRKLMRHREGAYVVEDLYVLYASNEQKQQMIREFWGSEYAVFRDDHQGLTIEKACESSVEKRTIISKNLLGTISASVEKGSTGFQILHAAMRQFVHIANDKEIEELIEILHESFAELVHTPEGSEVACTLIARTNAKERKQIIRSLRDHTEALIKNEYGTAAFITLLFCVDDTVLVHKTFGPSIRENMKEFLVHKYGRRPFLYLLVGLDSKYFNPHVIGEFNKYIKLSEATSKKPFLQRRHELLGKFAPEFLQTVLENYSGILSENLGCQFISELLVNDEVYEVLKEKDQQLFQDVVDSIAITFKGDITEEDHPIHHPFSVRLLKALIQGGKWNNKEKRFEPLEKVPCLGVKFAQKFYDEIIDSSNLLDWINNPDSSFTIVALFESLLGKKEGKQFFGDFKKIKNKIQTDDSNKGANLLLRLVKEKGV